MRLYAYDILSAIKFIHDNNIIHCDIKPQNFLLFQHSDLDESLEEDEIFDKIKLTDFGLAHLVNTKTGKAYMKYRAGTMEYKAPEIKDVNSIFKFNRNIYYILGLLCRFFYRHMVIRN